MDHVLYIILGWVSGLFSSVLLEWNRDNRKVKSLRIALKFEMVAFRHRMAGVVFMLSARGGTLTPERITWLINEFEAYSGPDRNEPVLEALRAMQQYPREAK